MTISKLTPSNAARVAIDIAKRRNDVLIEIPGPPAPAPRERAGARRVNRGTLVFHWCCPRGYSGI